MIVRITFRSEIFLDGNNLAEIRDKFEELPLYDIRDSNGKDVFDYGFCELVSVEDMENSYKDIMHEWNHCFEED